MTYSMWPGLAHWLRDTFPDWQGEVNGLLRSYHDSAVDREAGFDPDGFEPAEMIAAPSP